MKNHDQNQKTFEEIVDINPTYYKVVEAVKSIRRSIGQFKPKKGKKQPKLTIAGVAEKAKIERKTIYNNPQLYEWLKEQIILQNELKKSKREISVSRELDTLDQLPTNTVKKITMLREKIRIEQEKNKKLLGKMTEIKLETLAYKERIADLEQYLDKLKTPATIKK